METRTRTIQFSRTAAADGRIPCVISSSQPVQRDGYLEVLEHSQRAVDLSRVPLPLIECHDISRTNVGIVENIKLDTQGGKLRGYVRFGVSQRAKELQSDIESGIVRSLSVAYSVNKWQERNGTIVITHWTPFETSVVSCPADITAGFYRSRPMETQSPETPELPAATPVTESADVLQFERAHSLGITAERQRVSELTEIFSSPLVRNKPGFDLLHRTAIDSGWTGDKTRAVVLDRLQSQAEPATDHRSIDDYKLGLSHLPRVDWVGDNSRADDLSNAVVDALVMRSGLKVERPHPAAAGMRNMGIVDMMRTLASRRGLPTAGITRATLMSRAGAVGPHTHSDFSSILANVATKAVLIAMEQVDLNWRPWVREIRLPDFKPATLAGLGAFSDLDQIPLGGGPYLSGTVGDYGEAISMVTYGKTFGISRVALINDDLSSFASLSRLFAMSANRKLAQLAFGRLTANPVLLQDSTELFHANHGNYVAPGSGAAPSVTTLDTAISAMKKQRPYSRPGQEMSGYLNVGPAFMLVPVELELSSRVLVNSANFPSTVSTVNQTAENPLKSYNISVISDPLLSAASTASWYLLADPAKVDCVALAFLEGAGDYGLSVDSFEPDANSDSYQWKVRLDAGVAATDFRGCYKNAGA